MSTNWTRYHTITLREASLYKSCVFVLQTISRAARKSSLLCSYPGPKFVARATHCAERVTETASLGAVLGVAHPSSFGATCICSARDLHPREISPNVKMFDHDEWPCLLYQWRKLDYQKMYQVSEEVSVLYK